MYNYRPNLPVVAANLVFTTGSSANPVDKPGLASFTANMLQQGTATRNATQIADEAALLGTSLSSGSSMDGSNVGISSLTKNFSGALDLMADVVLHPTFPPEEIERRRASRLAAFADDRSDPNVIVVRTGVAALFGPKSPFGYDNNGNEASIKAMTRDDLVNFWKTNYVPNNAALVVAGDIPIDQAQSAGRKQIFRLETGRHPARFQWRYPADNGEDRDCRPPRRAADHGSPGTNGRRAQHSRLSRRWK